MATKKRVISGGGTRGSVASAALPPSKTFNDPQAEPSYDWTQYTINGEPIPESLWANMQYNFTDQWRAQQEAKRGPAAVTTTIRDADDKRVEKYRDGLESGHLILGQNPLEHMAKQYTPKGHRHLWVGESKHKREGFLRGVVMYQPVEIDDPKRPGHKMQVTQNGMILCSIPEELAEQRDKYYEDLGESKLRSVIDQQQDQVDRVMHDEGLDEVARRRGKQEDVMGIQVEDGETADSELGEMMEHVTE